MSLVLFRCMACGVVYTTDSNIDGPEICNECNKTIYSYELKPKEDKKCSTTQNSKSQ